MTLQFNRKQTIAIIAAFVFAAILILIVYFKMYLPAVQNLAIKQSELKTSQTRLSLLQTKTMHMNDNTFENTLSLQKQVPVKALSDQLLLDFEKAETISGTNIKEITFTDGTADSSGQSSQTSSPASTATNSSVSTGSSSSTSTSAAASSSVSTNKSATTSSSQSSSTSAGANSSASSNEANADASTSSLPAGMNSTLVSLSLEASGYFEMEEFIRQLEASTRIIEVNQIDFKGTEEVTTTGQQQAPLTFKMTVSAFYMPGLMDLSNQVPKMAIPAAGNKNDPFQGLPDIAVNSNTP
jgi:type IV pilus assembly protein PilO